MKGSRIEWTDHTFNPWIGCVRVSAGCDHCYAEEIARRFKLAEWGPHATRRSQSDRYWAAPLAWDRSAAAAGQSARVFCASMADVLDNRAPAGQRDRLWGMIVDTPHLDWLLLTKRPENAKRFLPLEVMRLAWLGVSVEDQASYERRWPLIRGLDCRVRFVSYEPGLGPLSMKRDDLPDWLIWGGESGPKARPFDARWARRVTFQCVLSDVPVFGKQWGRWANNPLSRMPGAVKTDDPHGKGGALLDGQLYREAPLRRVFSGAPLQLL